MYRIRTLTLIPPVRQLLFEYGTCACTHTTSSNVFVQYTLLFSSRLHHRDTSPIHLPLMGNPLRMDDGRERARTVTCLRRIPNRRCSTCPLRNGKDSPRRRPVPVVDGTYKTEIVHAVEQAPPRPRSPAPPFGQRIIPRRWLSMCADGDD